VIGAAAGKVALGRKGGRLLSVPQGRQWLRQRRGLGSGRAPVGRPDEKLALDIGRYAQCTDHFAPDVFEGIVVEVETSFYPAIGHAALGDEAPEDLFQHPRKVHVSAPVRRDLRGRRPELNIMARAHPCDPFSARQKSRQSRPAVSEHRVDLQFGVPRASRPQGGDLLAYHDSMIKYDCTEEDSMAEIERMTITLPADMAAVVKSAVKGGDYASTSEVVREALRDWKTKRALQLQELAALKAEIDKGLADLAEGRVQDFDADRIIERGKKLLASRSRSA